MIVFLGTGSHKSIEARSQMRRRTHRCVYRRQRRNKTTSQRRSKRKSSRDSKNPRGARQNPRDSRINGARAIDNMRRTRHNVGGLSQCAVQVLP